MQLDHSLLNGVGACAYVHVGDHVMPILLQDLLASLRLPSQHSW